VQIISHQGDDAGEGIEEGKEGWWTREGRELSRASPQAERAEKGDTPEGGCK